MEWYYENTVLSSYLYYRTYIYIYIYIYSLLCLINFVSVFNLEYRI